MINGQLMQNTTDTPSPMIAAIRYAALMLFLSIGLMILLILAALYVPENYIFRLEKIKSSLAEQLPQISVLAPEMILIDESKMTNESVAKQYADPADMLAKLIEFGRQEGVSRTYAAPDRCRKVGVRFVYVTLVAMRDAEGTRMYSDWLKTRDTQQGKRIETIDIGDSGYMSVSEDPGICDDNAPETVIDISFNRRNYIASVSIWALKDTNREEDLLQSLVLPLAELFDSRLR